MISEAIIACMLSAASTYDVPAPVLYSIMEIEAGKSGELSANTNGTYDLGLMQINSLWLPEIAKHWGISNSAVAYKIVNDDCTNINVASWILNKKINEAKGSLVNGIAFYHSRTPRLGRKYALKVVNNLQANGLIENGEN
jgi:soluble lytic murein transglycosylase-like protein